MISLPFADQWCDCFSLQNMTTIMPTGVHRNRSMHYNTKKIKWKQTGFLSAEYLNCTFSDYEKAVFLLHHTLRASELLFTDNLILLTCCQARKNKQIFLFLAPDMSHPLILLLLTAKFVFYSMPRDRVFSLSTFIEHLDCG